LQDTPVLPAAVWQAPYRSLGARWPGRSHGCGGSIGKGPPDLLGGEWPPGRGGQTAGRQVGRDLGTGSPAAGLPAAAAAPVLFFSPFPFILRRRRGSGAERRRSRTSRGGLEAAAVRRLRPPAGRVTPGNAAGRSRTGLPLVWPAAGGRVTSPVAARVAFWRLAMAGGRRRTGSPQTGRPADRRRGHPGFLGLPRSPVPSRTGTEASATLLLCLRGRVRVSGEKTSNQRMAGGRPAAAGR
jgi:hypothetical protein